ncbi:mas-related G-protein coupled receptor member H-like [Heteronotia binoei]|uniref:mas-related G-protein coupled receptor member H-like n=1 Tax=Heteronotia binoei TaxID=13085 RepID=UPI00292F2C38|nr:mas-related G-protein coupled receptor member H-like [Heteronotia binoei]
MANFSKTSVSSVNYGPQCDATYNNTLSSSHNISNSGPDENSSSDFIFMLYSCIFMLYICIIGLVGNGIVICLLGFRIKRSPFTIYILNLAVADFGVLLILNLSVILILTNTGSEHGFTAVSWFVLFMYTASQLLLTAISIDRCASVLFPIWYRRHRPPHVSTKVCGLLWVLSFLTPSSGKMFNHFGAYWTFYSTFIAGSAVFFPLIIISAMILLFKVYCMSQQPQRGRVLTIVLITLLFYLIFAFPTNAIYTLNYFADGKHVHLEIYGDLCACLNSCVNPLIYFLVGRKEMGQQRQSLKVLLQRAFQEEEEQTEQQEQGNTTQTSV